MPAGRSPLQRDVHRRRHWRLSGRHRQSPNRLHTSDRTIRMNPAPKIRLTTTAAPQVACCATPRSLPLTTASAAPGSQTIADTGAPTSQKASPTEWRGLPVARNSERPTPIARVATIAPVTPRQLRRNTPKVRTPFMAAGITNTDGLTDATRRRTTRLQRQGRRPKSDASRC